MTPAVDRTGIGLPQKLCNLPSRTTSKLIGAFALEFCMPDAERLADGAEYGQKRKQTCQS